jgi:DNA end-binding protein Ku
MARSIWNGTIAFGLMTVPVKLHTATESKTVHFREVHLDEGARIEHRRFCSKEDKEVPYKEVVKGFEVGEDRYVVLEKDEIAAAAGDGAHRIDVEHFVEAADIDPIFYDKTYYLGAGKDGAQPYRVLLDALEQTGRAGIGRFTFHDREYLAAIRPLDGVLALHTLRFHDEIVSPGDLDVSVPRKGPSAREVKMAEQLVESLHEKFDPTAYRDTYREAVLDMIDRKAKGKKIERQEPEPREDTDDLAAALEASLKGGKR